MKYSKSIRYALLVIGFFLLAFTQFNKHLTYDEVEHLHTILLVSEGKKPYVDFFQHHHPFMWYIFSFFPLNFNNISLTIYSIKVLTLLLAFINLFLFYLCVKSYTYSKKVALLSVCLTGSSYIFLQTGMELRPDNLMLTFFFLSLLVANSKKWYRFYLSGIFLGVSFLVLQKAILLLPVFLILSFFKDFKKEFLIVYIYDLLYFLFGFLTVAIPFWTEILISNDFSNYYFFNWTLNLSFQDRFSVFRTLSRIDWFYFGWFAFFLISLFSSLFRFVRRTISVEEKVFLVLNIFLILQLLLLIRSPFEQYLLPLVFFGSVLIAFLFEGITTNVVKMRTGVALWFLNILIPSVILTRIEFENDILQKQIRNIEEVRKLSSEKKSRIPIQSDNLFFTDHCFYWFSPEAKYTIQKLDNIPQSIMTSEYCGP